MRHNVLNSVGTFNRCKLTRLVIDSDWDAKVWKENWTKHRQEEVLAEEEPPITVEEKPNKKRSMNPLTCSRPKKKKKRKALELNDIAWGEEVRPVRKEMLAFLKSAPDSKTPSTAKQSHCKGETWRYRVYEHRPQRRGGGRRDQCQCLS